MSGRARFVLVSVAVAVTFLVWVAASSEVSVRLVDGQVIAADDVRRDGDNYVITLEDGSSLVLPLDAVASIQLSGSRSPAETDDPFAPQPLPESEGIEVAEPRNVAGDEVAPTRRSDQLAVFGEQSRFQRDIVDNRWRPETDWNMDPRTQNNWAPSTWSKGPIDPSWEPESAWDDEDVLEDSRSTWSESIIDNSWKPKDGFSR
jgi:hypothetical protein